MDFSLENVQNHNWLLIMELKNDRTVLWNNEWTPCHVSSQYPAHNSLLSDVSEVSGNMQ